jgi:hypothetical protein
MTEADLQAIHLSPGEGDVVTNPLGGPLTFKLRGEQTNGLLAAFESVAGQGEGPPLSTATRTRSSTCSRERSASSWATI